MLPVVQEGGGGGEKEECVISMEGNGNLHCLPFCVLCYYLTYFVLLSSNLTKSNVNLSPEMLSNLDLFNPPEDTGGYSSIRFGFSPP